MLYSLPHSPCSTSWMYDDRSPFSSLATVGDVAAMIPSLLRAVASFCRAAAAADVFCYTDEAMKASSRARMVLGTPT